MIALQFQESFVIKVGIFFEMGVKTTKIPFSSIPYIHSNAKGSSILQQR